MEDTFVLKKGDTTKEIFMSYGLLNSICRVVGDLEGAALMGIDNDLRGQMMLELLSERDDKGEIIGEGIRPYNIPYSIVQLGEMLTWAQEHVFDFFVTAAKATKAVADKNAQTLKGLKVT